MDVTDEEQPTTSFRSHNNDIFGDRQQLIQEITQFIMASCTKRGYAKDEDLGQFFANKSEREKREEIMEAAKKELDGLFGLKLVRCESDRRYYMSSDVDEYGIMEGLETRIGMANKEACEKKRVESYKDGILVSSLMIIYMSKQHLQDVDELPGLRDQFEVEAIPKELFTKWFGPPIKIAEFITQGWLICTPVRNREGDDEFYYDWGPRSEVTISKKDILRSFCKIYGTMLTEWPQHAKIAGISNLSTQR